MLLKNEAATFPTGISAIFDFDVIFAHELLMLLRTTRLALHALALDDAPLILELVNSPLWLRFIGDRGVKNISDAIKYLENGPFKSYRQHGYGLSKVSLLHGEKPIGLCGLLQRDYLDAPDIGFAFLEPYCGKGYGFEIASATIAYFRQKFPLPVIYAITMQDNDASVALLKKLGFFFHKELQRDGEKLLLFANRRDDAGNASL